MKPRLLEDDPLSLIFPPAWQSEPFGEIPYLEQVEYYAEQAHARKNQGAAQLILRDMPDLHEARAAVLGARTTDLSVFVSLCSGAREPDELLGALICLQALGVAGFGLDAPAAGTELVSLFSRLAPFAQTALLARCAAPPSADAFFALLQAGAEVLAVQPGSEARESASAALSRFPASSKPARFEDAPILLSDTSGVYYLEEDFTLSDEIFCSRDMLEEILEQEDMAFDALCFRLESVDDAHFLGLNAHMIRSAVCLQAAGPEELEMGLILYSGRALIDARSDVEEAALLDLSRTYGAVVR